MCASLEGSEEKDEGERRKDEITTSSKFILVQTKYNKVGPEKIFWP